MKPFIYSIIFLITINITFSQTKEVIIKKSFETNSNTTLNLNLNNVGVLFEESFDGKIHIEPVVHFDLKDKSCPSC